MTSGPTDDQLVTLLRDIPLPADPLDRAGAVLARRRRSDSRRLALLGAALSAVLVAGAVSVVTLDRGDDQQVSSLLAAPPATVHVEGNVTGEDGATFSGDVDLTRERLRYDLTTDGAVFRVVVIGDDTWISGPADTLGGLPAGKTWLHQARSSSSEGDAFDVSAFDPAQLLQRLRASDAELQRTGRATVDGTQTTRYRFHLGDDDVLFGTGDGELFVDGEGLVRRLVGVDAGTTTTFDFSAFDRPVTIEPPAPATVAEGAELNFSGTCSTTAFQSSGTSCTSTGTTGQLSTQTKAQICAKVRSDPAFAQLPAEQRTLLEAQVCG